MSTTVLAIGAAHALPIFVAAILWRKRWLTTVTALVMTAIAFATGQAHYLVVDLLAIVLVYFLCMLVLKPPVRGSALPTPMHAQSTPEFSPSAHPNPTKGSGLGFYLLVGGAIALFVWNQWARPPSVQLPLVPAAVNVPAPASTPIPEEKLASAPVHQEMVPPKLQEKAKPSGALPRVAVQPASKPNAPVTVMGPRIWREDQATLDKGCGPFNATGDTDGYRGCRDRVLAAVAAAGPPPALTYYPPELQESMYRACENYQLSADVFGHRKCMREKAAGVRVTSGPPSKM